MADDIAVSASTNAEGTSFMKRVICGPFTGLMLIIVCAAAVVVIVVVVVLLVLLLPGGTASCELKDNVLDCGGGDFGKDTFEEEVFKNLEILDLGDNDNKAADDAFDDLTKLTMFKVSSDNKRYKTPSGVLYDKKDKKLVRVPIAHKGAASLAKPDTIDIMTGSGYVGVGHTKSIQSHAFWNLTEVKMFALDTDIEKLPDGVFGKSSWYEPSMMGLWDSDIDGIEDILKTNFSDIKIKESEYPSDVTFEMEIDKDLVPEAIRKNLELIPVSWEDLEDVNEEGTLYAVLAYKTDKDEILAFGGLEDGVAFNYKSKVPAYEYDIYQKQNVPVFFKEGDVKNVKFTRPVEKSLEDMEKDGYVSKEQFGDILYITFLKPDVYIFRVTQSDLKCENFVFVEETDDDHYYPDITQFPSGDLVVGTEYYITFYNIYSKKDEIHIYSDLEPAQDVTPRYYDVTDENEHTYSDSNKNDPGDFSYQCKKFGSDGYAYCKVKVLNNALTYLRFDVTSTVKDDHYSYYYTAYPKDILSADVLSAYVSETAPAAAVAYNLGKDGKIEFCENSPVMCSSPITYKKGDATKEFTSDSYNIKCSEEGNAITCTLNLKSHPTEDKDVPCYIQVSDVVTPEQSPSEPRIFATPFYVYNRVPLVNFAGINYDQDYNAYVYAGESFLIYDKYPYANTVITIKETKSSTEASIKIENSELKVDNKITDFGLDCTFGNTYNDEGGYINCYVTPSEKIADGTKYTFNISVSDYDLGDFATSEITIRRKKEPMNLPKVWAMDYPLIEDNTTYLFKLSNIENKTEITAYIYEPDDFLKDYDEGKHPSPITTLKYSWAGKDDKLEPVTQKVDKYGNFTLSMTELNDFGRANCILDLPDDYNNYYINIISCLEDTAGKFNNCVDIEGDYFNNTLYDPSDFADDYPFYQLNEYNPILNSTGGALTNDSKFSFEIDNLLNTTDIHYNVNVKLASSWNLTDTDTVVFSEFNYTNSTVSIVANDKYPELSTMECKLDDQKFTTTCTVSVKGYLTNENGYGSSLWYAHVDAKNIVKVDDKTEKSYSAFSIRPPVNGNNMFDVSSVYLNLDGKHMNFYTNEKEFKEGSLTLTASNFVSTSDPDKEAKYSSVEISVSNGSNTGKYTFDGKDGFKEVTKMDKLTASCTPTGTIVNCTFTDTDEDKTYKITVTGTNYDNSTKYTFTSVGSFKGKPKASA